MPNSTAIVPFSLLNWLHKLKYFQLTNITKSLYSPAKWEIKKEHFGWRKWKEKWIQAKSIQATLENYFNEKGQILGQEQHEKPYLITVVDEFDGAG